MHHQSGWLSDDAHALQARLAVADAQEPLHCDLLIVGSGYGGAVAAARMSAAECNGTALRIIVVERGREYLPGMFPSSLAELPGHVRFSRQDGERPKGPVTALWDLRLGNDVNVVLGSGLGGGSLINAAVMERPEPSVWESGWPRAIDGNRLDDCYTRAARMLQANRLPQSTSLSKLEALQHLGDGLPGTPQVERCHIAVTFSDSTTPEAGVEQKACKLCGDCATGCNWEAKNSLDVNYLALAKRRRVDMYCGVLAHRIERLESGNWQLRWSPTDDTLGWAGDATPIQTRFLIVCAGSLGSTELLHRSQVGLNAGLDTGQVGTSTLRPVRFSPTLGSRFSTNGDMLAAAVKLPVKTRICADETSPFDTPRRDIGPTITGMLRSGSGAGRFAAQEFAIPAPLQTLLAELTSSLGMLQDMPRFDWSLHSPWQRGIDSLCAGQKKIDRTMVYGLMGDDGARGRLEPMRAKKEKYAPLGGHEPARDLFDGQISVQWPEARYATVFDAQHDALSAAYCSDERGWYLPNPGWRPLPPALDDLARGHGVRGPLTTVHPLGGCPMADTVAEGVVDWAGRVFDARAPGPDGTRVLAGLAVLDGAIVPRSLGINPSLTIAALAEHAIPELMRAWGLTAGTPQLLPLTPRPVWKTPAPRPEQPATAIRLLERVQGTLELEGRQYWSELQVRFAPIDDVAAFTRSLPRRTSFEHVELHLFPDRLNRDDEPQWRAQRDIDVEPQWRVQLSGGADVLFRYWSWWASRLLRSYFNVGNDGGAGSTLSRCVKAAIATQIGEQRGIDYLMHVDSVSSPDCPLRPGDRLRGRKVINNDVGSNPWRQLSEMDVQLSREPGLFGPLYKRVGRLSLDLRYFVRQHTTLLALHAQPDMVTALADVAALALFCMRVVLKIQLLRFIPPEKRQRDITQRRPGKLPGLSIDRLDVGVGSRRFLLTRYRSLVEAPLAVPIVLFHGFTASGSTFAHPSIRRSLVQYLCHERRDVWVTELPTSIAFEKRDAVDLSFEDVADLIPRIIQEVTWRTSQSQVDVLGHCIGAAMFCRAVLHDADLHDSVRSLTLSQVGPLIQMSAANQLRGYMASYLAQYLGVKTLDARPSFAPEGAGSLGQTLLDAVLASMPYPDNDRERVLANAAVTQGRPDFRLVRHRSDAMLGHLFELSDDSPMAPGTLDALDDILGYARVQTLAEIIHYTRLSMLTDADGRNREIASNALTERMGFPVLLLHGRRSGVFDWRGSLESYEWLRRSCVPSIRPSEGRTERNEEKLHLGLDTSRQLCVFEKFGHQDSMIGEQAPEVVFPVIGEFLRFVGQSKKTVPVRPATRALPTFSPSTAAKLRPTPWVAALPWVGPILGWIRDSPHAGDLDVSFVLHPSPMHARTRFVALVPMRRVGGRWQFEARADIRLWDDFRAEPRVVSPPPLQAPVPACIAALPAAANAARSAISVASADDGDYADEWEDDDDTYTRAGGMILPLSSSASGKTRPDTDLGATLLRGSLKLRIRPSEADGINTGVLLLTVHDDLPRRARTVVTTIEYVDVLPNPSRDEERARRAVLRFLADPPPELESGVLRLSPAVVEARHRSPSVPGTLLTRTDSLTFAVASCQYPAGILDQELAGSSYRRLARRLDAAPDPDLPAPQLLLLLGDQVYVDENAGLFDPVTKELAFDQIYDRNFGLPAFRAVTSRLPTFMMLDDHEIRDNWQPPPPGTVEGVEKKALEYFHARQAGLNPRRPTAIDKSYGFSAAPGGWPLFVLDTRTGREARTPSNFASARIMSDRDMDAIVDWLQCIQKQEPTCPKFVATPSVFLPLEAGEPQQMRYCSDDWPGYPASRARLLGEIARRQITNVIFLAGDPHLSMASELRVAIDGGDAVKVYSVVSSGLYAPWRFANAEPSTYFLAGNFVLPYGASVLNGSIVTETRQANDFCVIHIRKVANGHRLTVSFDPAEGKPDISYRLV